jgi:hypothetical protein
MTDVELFALVLLILKKRQERSTTGTAGADVVDDVLQLSAVEVASADLLRARSLCLALLSNKHNVSFKIGLQAFRSACVVKVVDL